MSPIPAADHHLPGHTARQTLFWNRYALGYDRAWDSPLTVAAAEVVADELSATTVIDLGCGTGLFAARLASRHASVTGVDQSRGMLKRAVRRNRIAVAIRADAAHTGLPDASTDSVICANILHLHPDPEAVLAEAVRLVRPGGRIAVVTPTEAATHHEVVQEERAALRGRWMILLADLVRRQVAMAAPLSDVRIAPPGCLADILQRCISTHRLSVVVERFIGRTQHILILNRGQ
ncbi:class I SAM-dependent methyltransferase [Brevibacterium spongiae]|uniref:Class I SAM-dependent methyltransferase n=1 Tax=Brevibacterium spongiae TaxID=2909672 RepID=A0ABY5STB6_9MICO|nr:class I SAM-dependent methyltransferase [Brevibacterium spongiae]UVI36346.1 class I SAM-dependent methyltransferase [Brevibacterium spongiae]